MWASASPARADPTGALLNRGSLALLIENDSLASGSDRNYSNGLQLTWRGSQAAAPRLLKGLGRRLGRLADLEPQSFGASLGHVIYTPSDTSRSPPDPADRPYAAMLYLKAGFAGATRNRLDTAEATLGLIGPSAQGEWAQSEVHAALKARDPKGWAAQLSDEVVVAIDVERRWRVRLGGDGRLGADLLPMAGVTVGTLRTEASLGAAVRLGGGLNNDFGPVRIRPSLAGGG